MSSSVFILDQFRVLNLSGLLGQNEQNDQNTIIIDVPRLLEHENDSDFGEIAKEAIEILNDEFGDKWREVILLYLQIS